MTQILEIIIKNMVNKIIDAGIGDPTHENISCNYGGTKIVFRLYSQAQWDQMLSQQNEATKLLSQKGFGIKPDTVVTCKDKVFLVKIIK